MVGCWFRIRLGPDMKKFQHISCRDIWRWRMKLCSSWMIKNRPTSFCRRVWAQCRALLPHFSENVFLFCHRWVSPKNHPPPTLFRPSPKKRISVLAPKHLLYPLLISLIFDITLPIIELLKVSIVQLSILCKTLIPIAPSQVSLIWKTIPVQYYTTIILHTDYNINYQ